MPEQTYEEWLEQDYWPMMGAETPPGTVDDDTADDDTVEDDTSAAGDDDTTDDESTDDDSTDDSEENEPEEEVDRVRGELEKTRKELASAQVAIRKARQEARKAREDAAKKGGNWEQVAKEREAELADVQERLQSAEESKIKAEEDLDSFTREVRVTRLASKLHFRDPEDAISQLRLKPEATQDDKSCERALRKLAEDKPYLVDQRRARGRAMGDGNGQGFLTKEQMERMTPEEINAAWEAGQIQQGLGALGGARR